MFGNFRVHALIAALILVAGIAVPVSAGLALDWKERVMEGNFFSGVVFSTDGSVVYAGGSQMLLRSWSGDRKWGGKAGTFAEMTPDSNYVVTASGDSVILYDHDGLEFWRRNLDKPVVAVAIASDASYIVEADQSGLIQSWAYNGDFIGRNANLSKIKAASISHDGRLVVIATDEGLKFLTPAMNLIWEDTKNGTWDSLIRISDDSSTVITAGGTRVSSHTAAGRLNWMKDFTTSAITDVACSKDCEVIVIGDQDGKLQVLNRDGLVRWDFTALPWINGVGISKTGQVIAVGSLDRTLYVLNGGGRELAKTRTDSIIRPRSVGVNYDGSRIAVADETTLSGYEMKQEPEMTLTVRTPVPHRTEYTETLTPVTTVPTPEEVTTAPTPLPTPTKSSLSPLTSLVAAAGIMLALSWRKA